MGYDLDLTILSIEAEPLDLVPQTIERHLEDFIRIGKEAPQVLANEALPGGAERLKTIQDLYGEAAEVAKAVSGGDA